VYSRGRGMHPSSPDFPSSTTRNHAPLLRPSLGAARTAGNDRALDQSAGLDAVFFFQTGPSAPRVRSRGPAVFEGARRNNGRPWATARVDPRIGFAGPVVHLFEDFARAMILFHRP